MRLAVVTALVSLCFFFDFKIDRDLLLWIESRHITSAFTHLILN